MTATGLATVLLLTACGGSEDSDGKDSEKKRDDGISAQRGTGKKQDVKRPMKRLWMPFPCGQKWRVNSYDEKHAPALDMVREPQHKTEGSTLRAAASGTVRISKSDSGAGNVVQIKHAYGYYTTYLHLKKKYVEEGQKVKRTTRIGTVGDTGSNGNTPHLHFEVAKGAKNADHWGEREGDKYRETANLHPTSYKGVGKEWRNAVSHSCAAPRPTKFAKYRVVRTVNAREWAGTKYQSARKERKGRTIYLGCDHYRKPEGKLFRRVQGGAGPDGKGLWVRASKTYVKKIGKCSAR
ncbi:M23 family metallopeptidase [Streptomyces sp. AJS327]|uniref:M23 family metallopeptidase n=1 Tax=Streptomyces sp. AJS327 TaxID=2545265 RepID=UPI0015E0341A|nr:M23 family metallopeptidase [Streptomyces sp. AJS327]